MAKWLVLVYRLPPEPSAPRVATWRALKRLEGRYLQDGVFAIAHSPMNDAAIRQIAHAVRGHAGDALVLDVAGADVEAALKPAPPEEAPPAKPRVRKKR